MAPSTQELEPPTIPGRFKWTVTESYLRILASEMAALGLLENSSIIFKVQQIGRFAQSGPLTFGLS